MKLHASGEDYLETILVLQKKLGMVRSVDVARHMEMSKPSVCHAVATLRNGGLDVTQNRRSTRKIHFGRTKLPALQRFFSFHVLRGRIAWLIRF